MSRSERVRLVAPAADGVRVTVTDHAYQPLASATGGVSVEVDPGLYSVRYVAGSAVHQQLVAVEPDQATLRLTPPPLRFDAPVPLASSTHVSERHLAAAHTLSRRVHKSLGTGAQLFVFVRDRDRRGRRCPLAGLSLYDERGVLKLDLAGAGAAKSEASSAPAWAGVNVGLEPGPYRLRVHTGAVGTLEQLVHLVAGWQTLMFLERRSYPGGRGGRTADLGDASILMTPLGEGFDPARDDLRLTELARQALSTGRNVLSERDLRSMLFMKFRNPMLGLYGAHMLLRDSEPRKDLLTKVSRNLQRLVPGHPDALAIALAVAGPSGGRRAQASFPMPPMLRASWDLIVRASAELPELVPRDSLAGRVSGWVYDSSTWLIWRRPHAAAQPAATRSPQRTDASVVDMLNSLAVAVPELHDEHKAAVRAMDPVEQDLVALAVHSSGVTSESATPLADERSMLSALGMPKSVAQSKLLDVAERLDVSLT